MAAGDYDSIFSNLPRPRRPGQQRSGPFTAADIIAGRAGPPQEAGAYDDPTISGQAGQGFERGAERLGAPMSVQRAAGDIGSFLGGVTGLDMPQHLSDAWNYLRYGAPGQAAMSAAAAAPAIPGAAGAKVAAKTAEEIAAGAKAASEGAPPIVAYHGSPYSFDQFDPSKIGTGEGAAAYGQGLYFAENEEVAKNYRDQLAKGFSDKQGVAGHMYQVGINADPERFLDWDLPYSAQSPEVQQAASDAMTRRGMPVDREGVPEFLQRDPTGEDIHYRLWDAEDSLRNAGIPGIKYLDQGSRAVGEGTRNYVVFDPAIIEILKRYGLAGALAPVGAGAATLSVLGQPGQGTTLNSPPPDQEFY